MVELIKLILKLCFYAGVNNGKDIFHEENLQYQKRIELLPLGLGLVKQEEGKQQDESPLQAQLAIILRLDLASQLHCLDEDLESEYALADQVSNVKVLFVQVVNQLLGNHVKEFVQ